MRDAGIGTHTHTGRERHTYTKGTTSKEEGGLLGGWAKGTGIGPDTATNAMVSNQEGLGDPYTNGTNPNAYLGVDEFSAVAASVVGVRARAGGHVV